MPESYANYQFRLNLCSPVAADSPFDSDTLWGRILSTLFEGSKDESELAKQWLAEIEEYSNPDWIPPLLISEGFQCDAQGMPWIPAPLAAKIEVERKASGQGNIKHKDVKKINRLPYPIFSEVCQGAIPTVEELLKLREGEPTDEPVLHPHVAMNRASNTGVDGQFHMLACKIYSPFPKRAIEKVPESKTRDAQEIAFFVRLRHGENPGLIEKALRRICREGWGKAKSRGLGRISFKSFEAWQPYWLTERAYAFVSLSHFCPAKNDPTEGYWKLQVKHPAPSQFVNGKRAALGEAGQWRMKSFLRLQAGSCFRLAGEQPLRAYYGRVLRNLLDPAEDGDGQPLPALFHYALAFPVPMKWPEEEKT